MCEYKYIFTHAYMYDCVYLYRCCIYLISEYYASLLVFKLNMFMMSDIRTISSILIDTFIIIVCMITDELDL